jgi:hypothetical protein
MLENTRRENVKTRRRVWCSKILNQTLKFIQYLDGDSKYCRSI